MVDFKQALPGLTQANRFLQAFSSMQLDEEREKKKQERAFSLFKKKSEFEMEQKRAAAEEARSNLVAEAFRANPEFTIEDAENFVAEQSTIPAQKLELERERVDISRSRLDADKSAAKKKALKPSAAEITAARKSIQQLAGPDLTLAGVTLELVSKVSDLASRRYGERLVMAQKGFSDEDPEKLLDEIINFVVKETGAKGPDKVTLVNAAKTSLTAGRRKNIPEARRAESVKRAAELLGQGMDEAEVKRRVLEEFGI